MKSFWKSFFFMHVAIMMMVMSWEYGKNDAAIAAVAGADAIPQESIRLRILADSDSPADQALKRRIRDEVIEAMNGWVTGPQTIEEARETVRAHLPELNRLVGRMVNEAGYNYTYLVELGVVPFPTKVYGDRVYPAGDYEALRITLGRGLGQNWWCVLFPPLCFVDIAAGETPEEAEEGDSAAAPRTAEKGNSASAPKTAEKGNSASAPKTAEKGDGAPAPRTAELAKVTALAAVTPEVEYRFFLADWVTEAVDTVKSWFA